MYNLENETFSIKKDLSDSKKKVNRLRRKMFLKTTITTLVLIGGVTTGILLPNPISMAVIMGCATVLSGAEGIKHTLKRLKNTKISKRKINETDKNTDEKILVNKLRASVNEVIPSAPEIYPNLRI